MKIYYLSGQKFTNDDFNKISKTLFYFTYTKYYDKFDQFVRLLLP